MNYHWKRRPRAARNITPDHAANWAAGKIGQRGAVASLDHKGCGAVRFWLRACGVPDVAADALADVDLIAAWNDTGNSRLADLQRGAATSTSTPTTQGAIAHQENKSVLLNLIHKEDRPTQSALMDLPTTPRPARGDHQQLAALVGAAVAQALAAMPAGGVDEDEVRRIVEEVAGGAIESASAATLATVEARISAALAEIKTAPRALTIHLDKIRRDLPAASRHAVFDDAVATVAAEIPLALIGPAGSGKTTLAEQIAEALGLRFYLSGALTGTHELLGYKDAAGAYHATPFRQAFEHGGVFLLDEIDGSDPAVPLALNSALANGFQAFPDRAEPVRRHADFRVIAGANTYWTGADRVYVGRNQLDGATLDRFAMLEQDYDAKLERALCPNHDWCMYVQAIRAEAQRQKVRLIVSMRASINGARLLALGMSADKVADMVLWKGADAEMKRRLHNATPDRARAAFALKVAA